LTMGHLRAVDLFSGMGCASLGLQAAGIEVVVAIDNDQYASMNYEKNVGLTPIVDDIRNVSGKEILDCAGLGRDEIDILLACPPCQTFSTLRRTSQVRTARDERNSLVEVFAKRVAEMLPQAVIFENVPGLLRPAFNKPLQLLVGRLTRLGYTTACGLLECANFGVPQFRKRVIALAVRTESTNVETKHFLPKATHAGPSVATQLGLLPWRTVRHAIGELSVLPPGQRDPVISNHEVPPYNQRTMRIIRNIPRDGGSRRCLPKKLWLTCHKKLEQSGLPGAASVYGRMWWDRPAPTITTRCINPSSGRFLHPEQDRAITLREAMRLQTIPDTVTLEGPRTRLACQVGNAVPYSFMKSLGKKVAWLLAHQGAS